MNALRHKPGVLEPDCVSPGTPLIHAHRQSDLMPPTSVAEASQLPRDVLLHVFRFLEPSLLISRAALVCKAWLEVAISETAWSRRFLSPAGHVLSSESPAGRALPPKLALALLRHCTATYPWPLLWAKLMQPCNLLQGLGSMPMGRLSPLRSTGPWIVSQHGGQGWRLSAFPAGQEPSNLRFLAPAMLQSAKQEELAVLASSYEWCEIMQAINLVNVLKERGLSEQAACAFLDCGPALHFRAWFGCDSGCEALAEAHVIIDGNTEALPPYRPARRDWSWDRPTHATWTSGRVQLPQGTYQAAECRLHSYPPGARRAFVVLRGQDGERRSGHWGAVIAAPQLTFGALPDLEHRSP